MGTWNICREFLTTVVRIPLKRKVRVTRFRGLDPDVQYDASPGAIASLGLAPTAVRRRIEAYHCQHVLSR